MASATAMLALPSLLCFTLSSVCKSRSKLAYIYTFVFRLHAGYGGGRPKEFLGAWLIRPREWASTTCPKQTKHIWTLSGVQLHALWFIMLTRDHSYGTYEPRYTSTKSN